MSLITKSPHRLTTTGSAYASPASPDDNRLATISETRYRLPLTTLATQWVQLREKDGRWYLACYENEHSTQPRFLPVLQDAHLVNNTTENGPCLFLICQNGEYEFQTDSAELFERWKNILIACGVRELKFRDLYDILNFIGEGTFARVYMGKHRFTHENVVVKAVDRRRVRDSNIYTEIEVLRKINHPYIIRLFAAYEQEDTVCLVLEHLKGGELFDWLSRRGRYSEAHAKEAMRRVLLGIENLHAQNIVHRDLKTENLILEQEDNPLSLKIIDFGLASTIGSASMRMRCGSPGYVAPEILEDKPYDVKVDIFSAGVILYTVLAGFPPFRGSNVRDILRKNLKGFLNFNHRCWEHVSADAINLITLMTARAPERRCSATEALNHRWFGRTSPSAHPPRPASALTPLPVTPATTPATPAVPLASPAVPVPASTRGLHSQQPSARHPAVPRVAPEVAPTAAPTEVVQVVRTSRSVPTKQEAAAPAAHDDSWLPNNTAPRRGAEHVAPPPPQQRSAVKPKVLSVAPPAPITYPASPSTASTASVSPMSSPNACTPASSCADSSQSTPPALPQSRLLPASGEPMWTSLESPVIGPMGSPLNRMISMLKSTEHAPSAVLPFERRGRCKTADCKTMQFTSNASAPRKESGAATKTQPSCASFAQGSNLSLNDRATRAISLPSVLLRPTCLIGENDSTSTDGRWEELLHTLTASIGCISADGDARQWMWFGDDNGTNRGKMNLFLVTSQYFRACHSRSARSLATSFCASPLSIGPVQTPQMSCGIDPNMTTDVQPQQRRPNNKTVRFSKSIDATETKAALLQRPRLVSAPPHCTMPSCPPAPVPSPPDMAMDGSVTPPPVMMYHEPELLPPHEPTPQAVTGSTRSLTRSKTGPAPPAAAPPASTGFNFGQFFRLSRRSRQSSNASSSTATTQPERAATKSLRGRVFSRNASTS